jgi:hypothetical protein
MDFLQLLIVPVSLAVGAYYLQNTFKQAEQAQAPSSLNLRECQLRTLISCKEPFCKGSLIIED